MVNDERLVTFLHSLDSGNGPYLDALQAEASGEGVPIIRQEMQSFLQLFLELKKPARILEVGTAVGFSALLMASFTPPDTEITTIENYEKRLVKARKNIASSPWNSRVELLDIPATPEHEKKLCKAMLRLIDQRIREIFRLRFYCKTHDGCLLEHMEENEHE